MPKLLQTVLKTIWEVLLPVPMPWRAGLIVGIIIIGSYQIIRRLLVFILLPEFLLTNRLRRIGLRPLPGSYAYGNLIKFVVRLSRAVAWIAVIIAVVGIAAWYAQPFLADTTLSSYIDQGVAGWYSLEKWALTGEWVAPTNLAPVIQR